MSTPQLYLLLLIIVANSAPIIIRVVFNNRLGLPIDAGWRLPDKSPLFGESKTWGGVLGAMLLTPAVAVAFGYPAETGLLVAIYAMLGDLFSSFIKRRLKKPASSMAPLLDQVPESMLPALMLMETFSLDIQAVAVLVAVFIICELVLSRIFYRLGIRKRPY